MEHANVRYHVYRDCILVAPVDMPEEEIYKKLRQLRAREPGGNYCVVKIGRGEFAFRVVAVAVHMPKHNRPDLWERCKKGLCLVHTVLGIGVDMDELHQELFPQIAR
ncbi:MAG: hypothetical protein AAB730_00905 [Patescibacteria group bacterium]